MTCIASFSEFSACVQHALGIEFWQIPVVMLSAVGIYVALMILTKVFGSRVLTGASASDVVIILMFGAVAGRVILGNTPTLAAGVIGMVTLILLEAAVGLIYGSTSWGRIFLNRRPVLIVAHGRVLPDAYSREHVSMHDIYLKMRQSGIGTFKEIQALILEPTGSMSIYREGVDIDRAVVQQVQGIEELYSTE